MALIKCPECGKEISDKANMCIYCGYPVSELFKANEENQKEVYWCRSCHRQNDAGKDYCEFCGARLTPYYNHEDLLINQKKTNDKTMEEKEERSFNGIYRYTLTGKREKVYCPRCGSEDCSHYKEQKVIPGKTKTKYTANLNPFKPFTLVNKKEKVIRKDYTITQNKIVCNRCGWKF